MVSPLSSTCRRLCSSVVLPTVRFCIMCSRQSLITIVTSACSYGYAPLVGVLVLLAARAADGETLRVGIVGDKYLKPYGIIILFVSQVRMRLESVERDEMCLRTTHSAMQRLTSRLVPQMRNHEDA